MKWIFFSKTGFWNESADEQPIKIIRSYAREKYEVMSKLKRELIVTTRLEAPYVMKRELGPNETIADNNKKYKGYCVDLLEKISKICGFNYTLKLVDDGFYGAVVNGKWNGLVSELIDKVGTKIKNCTKVESVYIYFFFLFILL